MTATPHRPSRLGLALFGLVWGPALAGPGDGYYQKRSTWPETMLATRAALAKREAPSGFKPFDSGVMRGKQEARHIRVDVSKARRLWLIATDAGNGIGSDHSVWCDPKLIASDGKQVDLTAMKPMAAKVGWHKLVRDKDCHRKPIHVAGRQFDHGLYAHAYSVVGYALEGKYAAFDAWIGVCDSSRGHGSVVFRVLDRVDVPTLVTALWPQMAMDFPRQAGWLRKDGPRGGHLAWFARPQEVKLEKQLIGRALSELGPAGGKLRRGFDALCKANPPASDQRWLDFYVKAADARDAWSGMASVLDLTRRTLAFVERCEPRPQMAAELARLDGRIREAAHRSDADWTALCGEVRSLRRRTILSHPLLAFDKLLVNKRPPPAFSHQCDQYLGRHSGAGDGLVVLENWKGQPKATALLAGKLPKGSLHHPDLSFDAKTVLFSFCDHTVRHRDHRRFFIYEADLDSGQVRQITGTARDPLLGAGGRQTILIEDWDPCYLPDGGIAFISTRSQNKGRCHGGRYVPSYLLYRMDRDGSNIRQLSFGESNEWDPSVLHDGRLIYCRWDYINRHDVFFQSLWVMHPDGTGTGHFYGNYTRNPCLTSEAKVIPGSHKVVCTAGAHHAYTAGSIIVVDPLKGRDGAAPITRVTPEIRFPETEGYPENGSFATPYPLSEDLFLAAFSSDPLKHQGQRPRPHCYAIYLVDTLGGRERIYSDPDMSCFAPIPIRPRLKPPALASALAAKGSGTTGTFYVQDVYQSTEPIPRGSVEAIRVNEIISQPAISVPPRGIAQNEIAKRIVGTAPVSRDGSAAFRAPAGVPLQLQLLDAHGMAVMTMRSFVYLQPGERSGCTGCHEPRSAAPERRLAPKRMVFHELAPPAGPRYPGGFSFLRTVQPVLDRYCIGCHGLDKTEGGISLLGTAKTTGGWDRGLSRLSATASYDALVSREGMVKVAPRNRETYFSKPKDYFAHAGKLAKMLLDGHDGRVTLDRESFQRIVDWLDLNAQFYGDYSFNRVESRRPAREGEAALRKHVGEVFGPKLAQQPFAALVNVAMPSESRILKAPLAVEAGGWGQIKTNGWRSADDPGYKKMSERVDAAIAPLTTHDVAGTCNQRRCRCRSCWVRQAEREYREQIVSKGK